MAAESPIALIYGYNGSTFIETSIRAGIAVPSGQPGFMALGSDGTNARYLKVSATGVVSVDGSAVTQPVSGTFWQATQPVSIAATVAVSGPLTDTQLRATPVPVSGTFWQATQPVSGPLTDTELRASAVPVSVASLPLPSGAATEATLATLLTLAGFQARINTLGQKTMANSTPVVLSSDQSAIPVSQSGSWTVAATQSGAWTATANAGTNLNTSALALDATLAKLTIAQGAALGSNTQALMGGSVTTAAPSYTTGQISPLSLTTAGLLRVDASGVAVPVTDNGGSLTVDGTVNAVQSGSPWNFSLQQINGNTTLTGNGVTGSGSQRVTIASDNTPFGVNAAQSGTWTTGRTWLLTGSGLTPDSILVNQNSPGTLANAWPVKVTDGTNTQPTGDAIGRAIFHKVTDGTNTATVTASGAIKVDGSATNQPLVGTKSNNGGAPGSTNLGVLPAVATVSAPTYTEANQVALSTDLGGVLRVTASTTSSEEQTFTVIATAVKPANNKSMLSIYNPTGSGYSLKLREFYLRNAATTAVTGVVANFELHRFASGSTPTGGTSLTSKIVAHDSNDATPASMDARTGGTISGEVAAPLDIIRMSTDEWGPGTADVESYQQAISNYLPARAKRDGLIKPFFARAGEGLHIKFATNSTAGSIDVVFVFTKV